MHTHLKPRRVAAALALIVAHGGAAAADAGPDATEQMFWQSTERLATPEAYRGYLGRYPNGFFAPLATAAINKGVASTQASTSTPLTSVARAVPGQGGTLSSFTEPSSSGAVSFGIGDVFSGPTAIGVGWLGAKKKLVLPAGQWIALAVQDARVEIQTVPSLTNTTRALLTTASFGRFAGNRLVSLMIFRFSAQKVTATGWSAVDGCEHPGTVKLQSSRPSRSAWRDECAAQAFNPTPLGDTLPATVELHRSLSRLGATVSGPAIVSTWSYSEKQRGLLVINRYDWPGPMLGNEGQALRDWTPENQVGERQAYAGRLWKWAQDYAPYASGGFDNDSFDDGRALADFTPFASK